MYKNYLMPENAKKTLIPPFFGYCEHCKDYEWTDWYCIDMIDHSHEFSVCRTCHKISEREWYYQNVVIKKVI